MFFCLWRFKKKKEEWKIILKIWILNFMYIYYKIFYEFYYK